MARPVTLMTLQFSDLNLEEMCKLGSQMGYEGLELAPHAHVDMTRAANDLAYCEEVKATLAKYGLNSWAISLHLPGQCVGDLYDDRLKSFVPPEFTESPETVRQWGIDCMMEAPKAAANLGIHVLTGFMGSPIWKFWYSFPMTSEEMVEAGFQEIKELWTPIFDEFDKYDVKFALEVHPTEIAFDYWSAKKLLEVFEYRKTLGFNFDPSHLLWQGIDPAIFARDFADRIYHVHIKDVKLNFDGRNGVLGSHITFGNTRRAWNFVSPGHGDVDFDAIIRELNQAGYDGPLSIEWEDSGMDRVFGATEACELAKKINFSPSNVAFDSSFAKD